ncbi:sigma intracellular receptor 2-like [Protobothrops mucrosquamatus]|uniref:sigma intracellular receptor 2-like n=1 Tax=Protobothrops mucrosquamatus TaxID=103944 RepID=UPI000775B605|nr:sigma intracellular receptor 2-like [Protobothrops mucrosquamatus]
MEAARVLEWIFAFYFLTHSPITLLFDLQPLLPGVYPSALSDMMTWYTTTFKDSIVASREPWSMSFLCFEAFPQLFFFPVAAYAFWKGNCKWIRIPVIIYATHVITTMSACLAHILFTDFSNAKVPAPQTLQERLTLSVVYAPFLATSLVMLLFVLFSSAYKPVEKKKNK